MRPPRRVLLIAQHLRALGLTFFSASLLCALVACLCPEASAQAQAQAQAQGQTRRLRNPTDLPSPSPAPRRDVTKRLAVKYLSTTVPNPAAAQPDQVRLRVYAEPDSPGALVGPSVRVRPGDTLRLRLENQLPPDKCIAADDHNVPTCFNTTNLHMHGWHISPGGNSDNVLLQIGPGTVFDYEFHLPVDHPAGTYWYHSHKHGATALQVSSGMAGALIVDGVRPLKLEKRGNEWVRDGEADIDTILKDRSGPLDERLLVFQQLAYSCKDEWGNFTWDCAAKNCSPARQRDAGGNPVGDCASPGKWVARTGGIESYSEQQFGMTTWQTSGRFTLINGTVQPLIEARAGKVERWRTIHAGVQDTINLRVTKSTYTGPEGAQPAGLLQNLAGQEGWVNKFCAGGRDVQQLEFAADGLTRHRIADKTQNVLQPGYRSDFLVAFPEPGYYCVLDDAMTTPNARIKSENNLVDDRRLLALVSVGPGSNVPWDGQRQYIVNALLDANKDLPEPARAALRNMDVSFYSPHDPIPASAVTGQQSLVFSVDFTPPSELRFGVNHQPYKPDRIDRQMQVGDVDDWTLQSISIAGHPFHIHVNPFQVVDVLKLNPATKKWSSLYDLSYEGCLKEEKGDPQYCDQKNVFRDTLFVKPGDSTGTDYRVVVRSRYERYIGDFVLHCHILDHEDFGMMQNVRIVPRAIEGAAPAQASGHGRGGHH
jgi:L-ascorbate oxidase